jgi:hypothetical protein
MKLIWTIDTDGEEVCIGFIRDEKKKTKKGLAKKSDIAFNKMLRACLDRPPVRSRIWDSER